MPVKAVPDGYRTVTPYLIVHDAKAAIAFYSRAFGATERMRFEDPSGRIGHAEIEIGDSVVMLADEHPEMGIRSPRTIGGTATSILLYVENVDAMTERAIAAGAKVVRPLADQFYGDRSATITDPFGHLWTIATHIEDVPPEEILRRFEAAKGP
jgi:PhnB protein